MAGILLLAACAGSMVGAEYHVSPTGNDGAAGTKDQPFKTIQRASDKAQAGDTCLIAAGIYRETVTPNRSGTPHAPIVFRASGSGTVTITGTEPVNGWTRHAGSIYKAKMAWSLGKNNQVFFDGRPLQEARWPDDTDGDPMTPDGMQIEGGGVDHILCSRFPADWRAGDLKGAVVWAIVDKAWSSWTRTVSAYDPGQQRVLYPSFEGNWWLDHIHNPKSKKGTFYLIGAMKLLDAPGEWFYDEAAKTLYMQAPENVDPAGHRVEAKSRQLGVDLKGRSWIVVDGINLHGCTLDMDQATHCVVRNMRAMYISHTHGGNTAASIGEKSGIYLGGDHNRLANCEIAWSAGSGVDLGGADNAVVNCWIHHVDYIGAYCAPVALRGMRNLVSHNTIANTGRDCIKLGGAEHLIQFNDVGFPGRICHDLGVIYSGGLDGGNTRIRYNFVHGNSGSRDNVGIYLDNYMKNYIVDHNVVWDVGNGIRLNRPTGFCMILNNTVLADINNVYGPWKGQKVQWGSHVLNNLCTRNVVMNPEVVVAGNLTGMDLKEGYFNTTDCTWGKANPGAAKGVAIEGITPRDNVDVGAYQHGTPAWRAGHDFSRKPDPSYAAADEPLRNLVRNAAFEYARYYKEAGEKVDPLVHWTRTHAGTAVLEHHEGFNTPPANARNSIHGNSVMLGGEGDNGIRQTLTGLSPKTCYIFSGYARHDEGVNVEFAVELSGRVAAREMSRTVKLKAGQTWRFVSVRFETGPNDTSATVAIVKRGTGAAHIDDTGVVTARYGAAVK